MRKEKRRRKVKDENVSYLLLETVTLIYLVSSHTSAFARHFPSQFFSYPLACSLSLSPVFSLRLSHPLRFSPSHPPRSLCHTCIYPSLFLTLSLLLTLQSLTSKKTSHAQFGVQPVKLALNTHTPAYTPITLAYSQGNNRIKEYSEIKRRRGANKRIKQTERDRELHIINLAGEREREGISFNPPPTPLLP